MTLQTSQMSSPPLHSRMSSSMPYSLHPTIALISMICWSQLSWRMANRRMAKWMRAENIRKFPSLSLTAIPFRFNCAMNIPLCAFVRHCSVISIICACNRRRYIRSSTPSRNCARRFNNMTACYVSRCVKCMIISRAIQSVRSSPIRSLARD